MPRLSVICPVYNSSPIFLNQSLSSVILSCPEDSELLVGLDGPCNADCYRVLERISKKQSRVHVKILPYQRQGLVATLNSLLESCDCEYIARQDSDDISLPSRIIQQIKTMEEKVHT